MIEAISGTAVFCWSVIRVNAARRDVKAGPRQRVDAESLLLASTIRCHLNLDTEDNTRFNDVPWDNDTWQVEVPGFSENKRRALLTALQGLYFVAPALEYGVCFYGVEARTEIGRAVAMGEHIQ
jgi:hypothetical protein